MYMHKCMYMYICNLILTEQVAIMYLEIIICLYLYLHLCLWDRIKMMFTKNLKPIKILIIIR